MNAVLGILSIDSSTSPWANANFVNLSHKRICFSNSWKTYKWK